MLNARRLLWLGFIIFIVATIASDVAFWRPSPFRNAPPITAAVVGQDTIRARATLDSLVAMMRSGFWQESWQTLPSGQYAVELLRDTSHVATIQVCSSCVVSGDLLRSLSDDEAATLARWFGVRR